MSGVIHKLKLPVMTISKLRHWKEADAGWFRDLDNLCFPDDPSFLNDHFYHWWIVRDPTGRAVAYAGLSVRSWRGQGKRERIYRVEFARCGVVGDCRGHGIQKKLIAARLRWCRQKKVSVVQTYTDPDNIYSQRNLKAAGFTARRRNGWTTFRKEL